jgi:hypothetical protein
VQPAGRAATATAAAAQNGARKQKVLKAIATPEALTPADQM